MSYVTVDALGVDYTQGKAAVSALEDVRFTLAQGSIGAIIGPSGSGKSTLLHVLAGLRHNYRGQVRIGGGAPGGAVKTALILQDYGLLPWKTVWDNVMLGLRMRGTVSQADKRKAEAILEKLGLLPLMKRFPAQLSGGQRQKAAIARALVLDAELLLMDEPFSALDALTREDMQDFLLALWQETGQTILIVTHNIEEAVFLGRKIAVLAGSPGTVVRELDNPLAGNSAARGKLEFLTQADELRRLLRGDKSPCQ